MQKTNIEWVQNPDGSKGYTWNPVRGCLHRCEYCYAARIDKRFGYGGFTPTFHPERLQEPLKVKKPSRIFVGSMADLFGDWKWDLYKKDDERDWPSIQRDREGVVFGILQIVKQCPQHTFIFLTKNPRGMQGFDFPANCWCGTSVENQEKADERIPELLKANCKTLFVSYEPALGPIDIPYAWLHLPDRSSGPCWPFKYERHLRWLIIGAQTGPGAVKSKAEWIATAVYQAKQADIPVFIKDNIGPDMGVWPMLREFPM